MNIGRLELLLTILSTVCGACSPDCLESDDRSSTTNVSVAWHETALLGRSPADLLSIVQAILSDGTEWTFLDADMCWDSSTGMRTPIFLERAPGGAEVQLWTHRESNSCDGSSFSMVSLTIPVQAQVGPPTLPYGQVTFTGELTINSSSRFYLDLRGTAEQTEPVGHVRISDPALALGISGITEPGALLFAGIGATVSDGCFSECDDLIATLRGDDSEPCESCCTRRMER